MLRAVVSPANYVVGGPANYVVGGPANYVVGGPATWCGDRSQSWRSPVAPGRIEDEANGPAGGSPQDGAPSTQ